MNKKLNNEKFEKKIKKLKIWKKIKQWRIKTTLTC